MVIVKYFPVFESGYGRAGGGFVRIIQRRAIPQKAGKEKEKEKD